MDTPQCYPLILEPIYKEKVWGGRRLEQLGKCLASDVNVGESWELTDLASTSTSGGGGGHAHSRVANGACAGKTLGELCREWGEKLVGEAGLSEAGGFPLLVKYLDARENLSVQVHPSIAYCKQQPGSHLKTECWYVLDAAPGSLIYKGVRPGVTRARFESELRVGNGAGIVHLLEAVPAVRGHCHNLPSGTIHALGAGTLVAEVQTPSDTTFRVFDWGRLERELHVEQSLQCISFEPARDAIKSTPGRAISRLVTTGYFELDEVHIPREGVFECRQGVSGSMNRPQALMLIEGTGMLGDERLSAGQTVLIPASITGITSFKAISASKVLRIVVRGS